MSRRINVRAIIYRDNKIFLARQIRPEGGENDYYCTVGGGLDPNESLLDGLKREVMEEMGIEPVIGDLLFIQQLPSAHRGTTEKLEFFFNILNVDDFDNVDLSKTTHGQIEIAEYGFFDIKTTEILPKFLTEVDIQAAIDSGRVQIFNNLTESKS